MFNLKWFSRITLVLITTISVLSGCAVSPVTKTVPQPKTVPLSSKVKLNTEKSLEIKKPAATQGLTVAEENKLPGTTSWKIIQPANGRIQGYASLDSVNEGGKITFYVSTQVKGTAYRINIFRLGYYQGKGGRLVKTIPSLKGLAQGWWNIQTGGHGLPNPIKNSPKGLLKLNWKPSYNLRVPDNWMSGYYVALLTDAYGYQSYIPFVVRDDTHPHDFLVNSPTSTWQAYNYWGNWAFYGHYTQKGITPIGHSGSNAAPEVSFDRPYSVDNGAGLTFLEYPTVYWLEKEGYDVSYTTSLAMDESKTQWRPKGFISIGHDEYWTSKMRDYVTNLRNKGVSLAFLGANDMYWKVRLVDHDRVMIGYRLAPNTDPLRHTPEATGSWRSLKQPESTVTGAMFVGQPVGDQSTSTDPRWYITNPTFWLFKGLKVYKGESVPGIIGWEFDSAVNAFTPYKRITMISKTPLFNLESHDTKAYLTTTLYTANSGALVFDAGTIWWGYGLSNPLHYQIFEGVAIKNPDYLAPSPIIQGVTRNLLNQMLIQSNKKNFVTNSYHEFRQNV